MGLIKELSLIPLRIMGDYFARPAYIPPVVSASDLVTDGPDDMWPPDDAGADFVQEVQRHRLEEFRAQEVEELKKRYFQEVEFTTTQWGLRLPNGEVHWEAWGTIPLSAPLDRLNLIATLQKTAIDMGLNEGEQTKEFLNKYSWQTREATSKIRYKNTESYALTDSAVSAAPKEALNHDHLQGNSLDSLTYSHRDLHAGSVGGDA